MMPHGVTRDDLVRAARLKAARFDFLSYARHVRRGLIVAQHTRILSAYLNAFAHGKIRRLMIFAPPRHGKSELVSRILPSFIHSINPTSNIIACSYSARLAQKMNLDSQRHLDSLAWRELNPHHGLGESNVRTGSFRAKRNADEYEICVRDSWPTEHDIEDGYPLPLDARSPAILGAYACAGVGGSLTGFGGDYAIIDDPIKDAAQASSATMRANIIDWYSSVLYTRLQDPGSVLIMHTRWDEADLAGYLLAQQERDPDADRWTVVNLPALYDDSLSGLVRFDKRERGEALWPERFDAARLKKIRAAIGPRWWNALYQGSPRVAEGSIFKREWIKTFRDESEFGGWGNLDKMFFSADLTFKGDHESDYVVIQVWGVKGDRFYLLDQVRDQLDFVQSQEALATLRQKWPNVRELLLEMKANGEALRSTLVRRTSAGRATPLRIVGYTPKDSKALRYYAAQPYFENSQVSVIESLASLNVYLDELTTVRAKPNGDIGGAKHDDQADATVQALLHYGQAGRSTNPVEKLKKLRLFSR